MSSSSQRAPRPALFGALVVALVVLVGADLTYFSGLENAADAPAQAEAPAPAAAASPAGGAARTAEAPTVGEPTVGEEVSTADTTSGTLPEGCRFTTPESPLDDPSRLVGFTDPVFGNPDATVTVAEFFDPNCPHCKNYHPQMQRLVEQYGDRVRFVFKPIPLWRRSVNQIEALFAAAQQDKFMKMLEAQFANQQAAGLSDQRLQQLAGEIGMNPDVLASQLREGTYRRRVIRQRRLAANLGVKATPSVAINGRLIARKARGIPGCVPGLIDQQIQQTEGS